jgi:hypothetical protein
VVRQRRSHRERDHVRQRSERHRHGHVVPCAQVRWHDGRVRRLRGRATADIILNTVSIVINAQVDVTAFTYTATK